MNLQVICLSAFANTVAFEGDRQYLDLSVQMSRAQIERAICTLLGQLTTEDAAHMLRSEFPELFTTEESTQ